MVLLEEYVVLDEQEIDFQGLPIFSGIDEKEASLFVRQVGGYVQTFSKGARIPYTHGDFPRIDGSDDHTGKYELHDTCSYARGSSYVCPWCC